jgi:hypothetical protein
MLFIDFSSLPKVFRSLIILGIIKVHNSLIKLIIRIGKKVAPLAIAQTINLLLRILNPGQNIAIILNVIFGAFSQGLEHFAIEVDLIGVFYVEDHFEVAYGGDHVF